MVKIAYRLDIKDTIKRVAGIGDLVDLSEDSRFAKIANGILSMERARMDQAIESTKVTLADWAGKELDNWWGTIFSIERLPGVESAEEFIGDASYVARIKRFMQAGNMGISLEAVRMAAEAGSGIPFRVEKAENRVILTPLEELDAPSKAGALRAVHRLAPARTIVEIGAAETYDYKKFTNVWTDEIYVGEDPSLTRLDGPHWDSENMMIVASADKWGPAEEGSLGAGSGVPNLLMREGVWHVPAMGFGETATLTIGTEVEEVMNRIKFSLGEGEWKIELFVDEQPVFVDEATSYRWEVYDRTFPFHVGSTVSVRFTNIDQDLRGLFVKGIYVGARVDKDNRETWLSLGGQEGENARDEVVIADPDLMKTGGEYIANPAPDPSFERHLYAQIGGSPQVISALGFKTRTPGAIFRISHSNDNLDKEENYPKLNWTDIPEYFKLVNGRVDIPAFKAKHIKITFTNLRPMLLKNYQGEEDDI